MKYRDLTSGDTHEARTVRAIILPKRGASECLTAPARTSNASTYRSAKELREASEGMALYIMDHGSKGMDSDAPATNYVWWMSEAL